MESDRKELVCKVMSEKDMIENTDKIVDKGENKQSENSDTKDKLIESKKSGQQKKGDTLQDSKAKKEVNLQKSKETEKINVNKDEIKNPIKNNQNKTLSTKDQGTKKKNVSGVEKKNSNENSSRTGEKIQSEFIEKLVSINRVAKVVKGGRRFSFAALVVVGDGNGMVGHGKGKAKEVPEAIKKATDEAKNSMIRVPLRQGRTLHHDIKGRFDSGNVFLRSAPSGTGVIAGGPMRAVFEALGIQDIVAKSIGSSNPHNMVRATFEALKVVSSPKIIASRRGLKVNDITKRRKNPSSLENAKA